MKIFDKFLPAFKKMEKHSPRNAVILVSSKYPSSSYSILIYKIQPKTGKLSKPYVWDDQTGMVYKMTKEGIDYEEERDVDHMLDENTLLIAIFKSPKNKKSLYNLDPDEKALDVMEFKRKRLKIKIDELKVTNLYPIKGYNIYEDEYDKLSLSVKKKRFIESPAIPVTIAKKINEEKYIGFYKFAKTKYLVKYDKDLRQFVALKTIRML